MKQYIDLLKQVLLEGESRTDRTGTGTLSLFGTQTRYDLREGFPLITTRSINFDVVVKELFWFLRGETNINTLDCKIWNEWADQDGNLGPIYGHQWRHGEVDQIAKLVQGLEYDPFSRRHIVSAWNVGDVDKMKLPPCHTMFQVYVNKSGEMDLQLYQRSADLAIGVPFNIASYSLLLTLLARALDKKPRYFIHTIGDAHIYKNHVEGVVEQIRRGPRPLPQITTRPLYKITVDNFCVPSFWTRDNVQVEIWDYKPWPEIKYPVAV